MKNYNEKPVIRVIKKPSTIPQPSQPECSIKLSDASSKISQQQQQISVSRSPHANPKAKQTLSLFAFGPVKTAEEDDILTLKQSYSKRSTKKKDDAKASMLSKADCETVCGTIAKSELGQNEGTSAHEAIQNSVSDCSRKKEAKELIPPKTVRRICKKVSIPVSQAVSYNNKVIRV